MIMNVRRSSACLLIAAIALGTGACNFVALAKPAVSKTVTAQGDVAGVTAQLGEASKEVGFKFVSANTEKGIVTGSRGYGYTESTYLRADVKPAGDGVEVKVEVKSSGEAKQAVDQIIEALAKRVKTS
jgi:hypothetical protein